jgi:hypothetical protein
MLSVTEAEAYLVNNEMMHKADEPAMQAGDFYFKSM